MDAKNIKSGVKTVEEVLYHCKAGFSMLYISTQEMVRATDLLVQAVNSCQINGNTPYKAVVWDILGNLDNSGAPRVPADPMEILQAIDNAEIGSVFFLKNFSWFLKSEYGDLPNVQLATHLQNNAILYSRRERRKVIIIMGHLPFAQAIPDCLKPDFVSFDFGLPTPAEIEMELERICNAARKNPKFVEPSENEKKRLVDAALGLTLQGVSDAFGYCLVKYQRLDVKAVDRIKAKEIEKAAGVYYAEYTETFEQVRGLKNIKKFCLGTIKDPDSKGVLLLGPPGTGKTLFSKCLGNETGLRMLSVEMAEFQGGIVGETEKKFSMAIAIIKAMAGSMGVIVQVDEIEKGLAGAGGTRQTVSSDSITSRAAGQWLKFMQDPGCRVYFIATCNNVQGLPPEYLRAERWDTAPFFIDIPNALERKDIMEYYMKKYNVKGKLGVKDTDGWSGAELRAVCRIAKMMRVTTDEASAFVVPISATMDTQIGELRSWAMNGTAWNKKSRCIPANTPVSIKAVSSTDRAVDM